MPDNKSKRTWKSSTNCNRKEENGGEKEEVQTQRKLVMCLQVCDWNIETSVLIDGIINFTKTY